MSHPPSIRQVCSHCNGVGHIDTPFAVDLMYGNHTFRLFASVADAVTWLTDADDDALRHAEMLTYGAIEKAHVHRGFAGLDDFREKCIAALTSITTEG